MTETKNTLSFFDKIGDDCLSLILEKLDYNSLEALARTNANFRQRIQLFKQQNPKHIDEVIRKHILNDDDEQVEADHDENDRESDESSHEDDETDEDSGDDTEGTE